MEVVRACVQVSEVVSMGGKEGKSGGEGPERKLVEVMWSRRRLRRRIFAVAVAIAFAGGFKVMCLCRIVVLTIEGGFLFQVSTWLT